MSESSAILYAPRKDGDVAVEMKELKEALGRFDDTLDALHSRLAPVLLDGAEKEIASTRARATVNSPLASQISAHVERVRAQNVRLARLIDMIQL